MFYAIPENNFLNLSSNKKDNIINISERKITFIDLIKLIRFIDLKSIDIIHAMAKVQDLSQE